MILDVTEKNRILKVEVEIPFFGSEIHERRLAERLDTVLNLKFSDVKIVEVASEVDE